MQQAFGPAYVLLSHIYVDRRVLDAPAEVREYLLLHEWGHVVRRHNQVAMLSAVLLPFVFFPHATRSSYARARLRFGRIIRGGMLSVFFRQPRTTALGEGHEPGHGPLHRPRCPNTRSVDLTIWGVQKTLIYGRFW
jgi:hypothetical protein